MTDRDKCKSPQLVVKQVGVTRRDILEGGTVLGVTAALLIGRAHAAADTEALPELHSTGTFEVPGDTLTAQRVKAMRGVLENNLKHFQVMREFDPDEEDPLTMFRA